MQLMKEKIKNYFENNNRYISDIELKKKLAIKGEDQTNFFYDALKALIEEGSLFFDNKKGYRLFTNDLGYAYGEIEINKSGNGFVHTKDGETIFIKKEDLNGALNGDNVIISSIDFGRGENYKGEVYKILKRKTGNIVFEVIGNGYHSSLVPYNTNENVSIHIDKNEYKGLLDGQIILVKVSTEKLDQDYIATISKIIGNKGDANIDINVIYEKNDVPIEFSKEAQDELDNIPTEVTDQEIKLCIDLRDKDIIAIDCDETKDRDDAICVEKLENGNLKLYTCISAVNHYIKRGTKLFEEVLKRCTSYYPGNTCNPMIPQKISNGICSLNEGEDRLVKACVIEITKDGHIVDYSIYNRAVIKSRKSMKYSEVNRVLNGEIVEGYENYENQLNLLKEMSDILEKMRINRNCIDFDLHDIETVRSKNGHIMEFKTRGNGYAERIIENCMLITGTTIAEHYSWLPFLYRIQEAPNLETIQNTIKTLRLSGFKIPNYSNINESTINNVISRLKNKDEAEIVKKMLLKSTKKASYSTNNVGHFALQLDKYCHFTAPIRRVADFMIHTIIDEIETMSFSEESIKRLEEELELICRNASQKERLAKSIESEVLAMDMAEYMEKHIGEKYGAIITEVYPHGMFIKTTDNISGKVKFENIPGDKYKYDDNLKAVIGSKNKTKYQIGNRVVVIAKEASKEMRTIDFEIQKQKKFRKQF